ncbi:coiled-coil domain-containing protein [Bacillus solitudinis]|uniref:YhgE/Pip domain-containing protein n=1 Tax=Bacillus solitudinis TaxID=2014074 RepID=UPI0029DE6162|nr:YhgE/Pip domain-containing protein [Bacillus solitudinis]
MRMRKFLLVFATMIIVAPSFLVSAAFPEGTSTEKVSEQKGEISSKDEVVYANLSATGDRQEMYVVNMLEIEKAGEVTDYGEYTTLKNLTDVSPIKQSDSVVSFAAPEGTFYYQGNLPDVALPWGISVSYLLDGEEIDPKALAGKDGHVQIRIATTANENVDSVFFENYLLQISLALNLDLYRNIQAPDGMLANAGKNKQVTFTVMPEQEATFVLEADVIDFELEGINITAVPSSMSIDAPNIDEMTGDIQTLTDAIEEVNDGVGELNDGVSELNNGVGSLRNGSKEYKQGMTTVATSSSELVNASTNIKQALETMNKSLGESLPDMNVDELKQLQEGLVQLSAGLNETSKNLVLLNQNYATAYGELNKAMQAIPDYTITEEEIQQLYVSGANEAVLDQLIESYTAARMAKGTYSAVKEGFDAVTVTLEQVDGALSEMAKNVDAMAEGLSTAFEQMNVADSLAPLQEGIRSVASNYQAFHSGLVDYTGGVGQLSSSYGEMHNGIVNLSQGTGELENGVNQLHDGTEELYEAASDLPDQMKEEVDQMLAEYDKSDFEPVSFVSPKNENINSVQFVVKTESIKKEEAEETTQTEEEPKGFWAKLIDLFK